MPPARTFVRHHKLQTDHAISQAYLRLPSGSSARVAFAELLQCARQRSPSILAAPAAAGHPGVRALFHLARFRAAHVRSAAAWPGSPEGWQGAVASLAQHLLGRYRVPRFLAAAWYAEEPPYAEAKRRWFVAHGAGTSFRSLDLPIRMTRRMEHFLLASRDHLGIEQALRRAEMLGLDLPEPLAEAVLATPVGTDLAGGPFWRAAWAFLAAHSAKIDLAQVAPLIDFLQAVRHEPRFSLAGRTPRSLLRLVDDWHRSLRLGTGQLSWTPSRHQPMTVEIPNPDPTAPSWAYELRELTNSAALRAEGAALHHCVASYQGRCASGTSRIWSLRLRRESTLRPMLTIEIDPKRNAIVQARGLYNRRPTRTMVELLQNWAQRERLRWERI